MIFVLDHCKSKDLTSLRYAFELEIMKEIINKNDPDARRQLEELILSIDQAETTKELEKIDLQFHSLISSLTDNPLLESLLASIHTVYMKSIVLLNASYPSWNRFSMQRARKYQKDIIQALLSGNVSTVEKALRRHYQYNFDADI